MARPLKNEFKLNYPFAEFLERLSRSESPIMIPDNSSAKILGKIGRKTKAFGIMKNREQTTFLIQFTKIEQTSKTEKSAWFKF